MCYCSVSNLVVFIDTGTGISGTNKKPYCTCWWRIITGTKNCKEKEDETIEAAARMHESTNEHSSATFEGLFDTLQKRCKLDTLTNYVTGNKQLTNSVVSKEYRKNVLKFEKSDDNIVQSIATYYASGVMGKRKYKSVRLVLSMKSNESKPG